VSQPNESAQNPGPIRRLLEGIITNVVSAALLWLAAKATGLVEGYPQITWIAIGVTFGAIVTVLARYLMHHERLLWRVREFVNFINLSTPAGCVLALIGGASLRRTDTEYRMIHASGYRLKYPIRMVFTIGNVVISPFDTAGLPGNLLAHERRHATQYAWCLGLLAVIPYALACTWSWMRTGRTDVKNIFETRAGFDPKNYEYRDDPVKRPPQWVWLLIGLALCSILGAIGWLAYQLIKTYI
jgi:hypothetical protein